MPAACSENSVQFAKQTRLPFRVKTNIRQSGGRYHSRFAARTVGIPRNYTPYKLVFPSNPHPLVSQPARARPARHLFSAVKTSQFPSQYTACLGPKTRIGYLSMGVKRNVPSTPHGGRKDSNKISLPRHLLSVLL